ncbi:MAG: CvpA family protein [Acetobacter sp.]|nr:CvpA family protein [Acetobacter sp.]
MIYSTILIFLVIEISTLHGIWRGFSHTSLDWCLWILVSIAIARFRAPIAVSIEQYVSSPILAQIASSVIILVGVVVIGNFLSSWIVWTVRTTSMTGADRCFGGLLGFVRGVVFSIILFFVIQRTTILQELGNNNQLTQFGNNDQLTPFIQFGVNQLQQLAPSLNLNFNAYNPYNNFNDLSDTFSSILAGMQ